MMHSNFQAIFAIIISVIAILVSAVLLQDDNREKLPPYWILAIFSGSALTTGVTAMIESLMPIWQAQRNLAQELLVLVPYAMAMITFITALVVIVIGLTKRWNNRKRTLVVGVGLLLFGVMTSLSIAKGVHYDPLLLPILLLVIWSSALAFTYVLVHRHGKE